MASKRRSKQRDSTLRYRTKRATKKTPVLGKNHAFAKPPEGYVFVPKGDVYITRKCTTLTQESGQEVHIVYSQNATRVGLHVPKDVCRRVLAEAEQTAEKRREAVCRKDDRDRAKAKAVLRKCYPKMPLSDLEKVLSHAFRKGSGRVGRASGQSVERRASLAIGAHIRHNYTAYDEMLNRGEVNREQARNHVRKTVQDVKLGWTGKASTMAQKNNSSC